MDSESKKMGVDTNDPAASAAIDLPMDLSNPKKTPGPEAKAQPTSPPEKPAFVKKRWLAQSQATATKFIPLQNIRNAVKRRAHEMDSFTTATTTTTTTSSTTGDSASLQSNSMQQWDLGLRLDRANSVPYLSVLPPLQRHKSLSESRIAPKVAAACATVVPPNYAPLSSTEDKTVRWLIDHQQELQRQRMQQMDLLQQHQEPAEININYYTKMVQFMQNQEILRATGGVASVPRGEEDDGYDENDDDECPELAEIDYSSSPSQVQYYC